MRRQKLHSSGTWSAASLPANLVLVPQLCFSEAANALWKYVSHNQLSAEQAIERYQDICAPPNQATSDQTLALEALSLASTYNHPVYDMIYAALARRNACGVLSKDSRLAELLTSIGITTAPYIISHGRHDIIYKGSAL